MKNIIFVDLDETLIHTFLPAWGETPTKDAETVSLISTGGKEEEYNVVLRQGALHFLQILRKLGDVYILTAATNDYANVMNRHFGLGFVEDQIYSREDVQAGQADAGYFGKGTVYLFDNLPRHENRSKIQFLRPLGNTNYIQVREFYNNKTAAFTHEEIKELVSNIK
jgi:FMN phosphatase YigB (HAD superfamily)